ncbi:MAG: hypothetical protein EZS28_051109, partial [Streblomastix strix]
NTLIANMKHNKQPQLLLLKSKQYLDPMPVTPMGEEMKEELKEWNMHEDSYINPKYCRNKQISKQYDKQEDSYKKGKLNYTIKIIQEEKGIVIIVKPNITCQ